MSIPVTADSYVNEYIRDTAINDPALIELFNGKTPAITWKMPIRQAALPFIVFTIKIHDTHHLPYKRDGKLYFSTYDYTQSNTRLDQITDRLAKLFRVRGFPDIPNVVSAIRIFENSVKDEVSTDSETVMRYDMSFPISWWDQAGVIEKLSRSFPQIALGS